jgi:pseudaminic acid synthase
VTSMSIAGRLIGPGHPPFIIAEISGNHNGSLERALRLIDAIAATGADAVKLQTYTADTMTLDVSDGEFRVSDESSPWYGETLHSLYHRAHTPWNWHEEIFHHARDRGLIAFSTPFDRSAVEFLEGLDVPAYKIASFEITDLELIRMTASTRKPLIISTGLATIDEISEAVEAARSSGCSDLVLLKCTSRYPAEPSDLNLATIPHLRSLFKCEVGLSDHTLGIGAAIASIPLGASVIEKHVTLRREDGGVDSSFSLEPEELATLVQESRAAIAALGSVRFGPIDAERPSLAFRRSLYVAKDLRAGDVLTHENLRAIRPGFGLAPRHLPELLGKRVNRDLTRGTPASWDMVE